MVVCCFMLVVACVGGLLCLVYFGYFVMFIWVGCGRFLLWVLVDLIL